MNVCMMVANPILYDGRVIRHAKTLVEAGHRVTVIGVIGPNDSDGELPSDTPFAVRRLRRQRRGLLPQAIWATTALRQRIAQKLVSALPDSVLGQLATIADLAVATSAVELTALTIGTSYDVFHGNDLNTLPAVAWAAQLHGTPYLYDAHEFYIEESPTLTQTEKRARQLCEQRLSQRAFAVLTVNDLLADELMQRHQIARPVVVRNVPPRFQTTDPLDLPVGPTGTLRLIYHGTHIGLRQPGTDDVLRAMARLRNDVQLHLTLRGQISHLEQRELTARVRELGLMGRVETAPPVPGPTALLQAAVDQHEEVGLAFHPPLSGNFRLATSSKVYEYQVAGLAVCATDVPGNHVILDDQAGVFYPFGDDEKLAAVLKELAQDRPRLQRLRHSAHQRGRTEFAWESERQRLLAVYDALSKRVERRA